METCWKCVGQILEICQAYIENNLEMRWTYLGHMLELRLEYVGHMLELGWGDVELCWNESYICGYFFGHVLE